MYKGKTKTFKLEGQAFPLARPGYREMDGFIELVDAGKHIEALLEAAQEKEALDKLLDSADHENIDALIEEYETFAGHAVFTKTSLERQLRLNELTYNLLKAQGITTHETFQSYTREQMNLTR